MKKRLLAALLSSALVMTTLAGCSSKSGSSDMVTELTEPITIEMWHYMNGGQAEALNSIIEDFNATNDKGITVNAISQGSIGDLNKKVISAAQSNSLPAIINVYPDLATGLIEDNKLVDLALFINDENVGMADEMDDFVDTFIEETSQWGEGKIYGLPMTKSTEVLYVNKNMLESLGYTLEDLEDLTFEKLAEISNKAVTELGVAGFGFDSSSNAFISSLKMDGPDFVESNGTINVDNEWVREYMTFFQQQAQSGAFRIAGEDKFLSNPFVNQKMLCYQGSSAGYAYLNNDGAFEIAVVEVPVFQGKDKAVMQQGASLFVTNNVSAEAQYAAYEFVKFATNAENTAKFATATGYLPVRKSAIETDIVKNILNDETSLYSKVYNVAQEALSYAYYTPAINNAQSARTVAQEKYEAFMSGSITDVEVLVDDIVSQVETSIGRK
ncbi:MAG: extracellular solute-binding protein [Clostridium sp.]|uniref:extracellular solute-binding protein n=1 Tax=Clostridium sp. TaxID=1506 RepID=UPI0026720785|nr:extracellular solute-binding protein [Clostridium sp.]MCI7029390.1 extracellular solute-binding protein [Clostridium sp.]MDD7681991.1 extracellular solute-binding protein [Clostridium sp.]MDY2580495.1 extracellular solute-binding protein [Clostridium sp.]